MAIRQMAAFVIVLGFLSAFHDPAWGQLSDTSVLEYSYSGKQGSSGIEFMRIMAKPEVRKVLLELASAPRDQRFLDQMLEGAGVSEEPLEKLGLIRREGNAWVLKFTLFTNADMDRIREVAEVEGKMLAARILERSAEIREILMSSPQPGVDWRARAFFVLGYASLDNDGLNLLGGKKYLSHMDTDRYIPFARQKDGGGSARGLYWGSHNMHLRIALTSFGDHHSLPRKALPDLLWSMKQSSKASSTSDDERQSSIWRMAAKSDEEFCQRIGKLMLPLRGGGRTVEQLAKAADLSMLEATNVMKWLVDLEYVEERDGRYHAIIPIFTGQDKAAIKKVRRLGRDVMVKWLEERYGILAQELSSLTPQRYGVALADGFYTVWHYIFGIANRELVVGGLFADPYDVNRTYKGFIPAVYPTGVVQGGF